MTLPTREENPNGFHQRYNVTKTHGEQDPNAIYFVLRIDRAGKDAIHTSACRIALLHYAKQVHGTHLQQVAVEALKLVGYNGDEYL